MPEVDLKNLQQHASNTLDSLDSTLELVEKQAGKYVTQLTSFFSGMVSVNPGDLQPDESTETLFKTPLNPKENYGTSRYDNDLYNLHTTASIYTSDEADSEEEIKKFNADAKTAEISKLLKDYPNTLTKLMNDLVPVKISYELFWYRYFKAEAKLKESEKKRKELLKRKETRTPVTMAMMTKNSLGMMKKKTSLTLLKKPKVNKMQNRQKMITRFKSLQGILTKRITRKTMMMTMMMTTGNSAILSLLYSYNAIYCSSHCWQYVVYCTKHVIKINFKERNTIGY